MSNQAFVIEPAVADHAAVGDVVALSGDEGHHAVTVKRVRAGERIDLMDGRGRRLVTTVETVSKRHLEARVEQVMDEPRPARRVTLIQALAKGDRDTQAVEAAVELGVSRVVPWQAERCVVRWSGDKAQKGRSKWAATVRAAVKQSRRAYEPDVDAAVTTTELSAWIAADAARAVLVLHEAATQPLAEAVTDLMADQPDLTELGLVVGPEGGISPAELEQLTRAGARPVLLGQHVLRAGTAGPAGVVLVRHLVGEL
ncbi:16S rRNA (uracil(1498)-N(3))-methyltransferase [Zhihengliuella flava]|uniref:Ribosomal RNA small subunit methyltransferase E n=1 Tax=Zhihengliuella flava TaxID=1285193 RepID=A0A931D9G0_9MICC|nr:16S rRNA (uracil(1498)-N(3))-methyltransferase [Zhihengliuella flava]MBG6083356.1 16S rRNA (uracil1498-N3)-methyltransferase [Zhihengliuella flava]